MLGSGTGGWSNMYVEKFASGVRVRKYFEIKFRYLTDIPNKPWRINYGQLQTLSDYDGYYSLLFDDLHQLSVQLLLCFGFGVDL